MWCQFHFVSGNAVFRSPHVPLLFFCCQLQKYSSNPEPSHFHFEVVNIPCINFFLKKKMTCKCAYKLLLMISAKKLIFLILFVLYVALNGKILQSSRVFTTALPIFDYFCLHQSFVHPIPTFSCHLHHVLAFSAFFSKTRQEIERDGGETFFALFPSCLKCILVSDCFKQ